MTTIASTDIYRCHWCVTLNDAAAAPNWCLCATTQPTLVCTSCKQCFCKAPEEFKKTFWQLASASLIASRWTAIRNLSPNNTASGTLTRPVILVVDDSKVIHAIVDTILKGFHGTILHAHDGAEALRIARAVTPEILLTDALLPGLDGRDVARLLKSQPSTSGIRTIVMTALYKGSRYRNEAFSHFKVDAYIEKPVTAAQLRAVINEMLENNMSPAQQIAS